MDEQLKMKLKIIEDYLLLIEKVYGFKVGDWNYEEDNTIPVYQFDYNIDEYPGNKIIAYYPLTKEAKELDLPLLPNPFEEEPLMKQASKLRELRGYHKDNHYSFCGGFIEGYKAASKGQFSLEDIKKAIEMARMTFPTDKLSCDRHSTEHIIQSLSTQRLPKEFIPKYDLMNEGYNKPEDYPYQECKVLKTITNSEGKQELVGTYKY